MNIKRINLSVFIFLLLFSAKCLAADLLSVYKLAEKNDPTYLQEVATYKATLEVSHERNIFTVLGI